MMLDTVFGEGQTGLKVFLFVIVVLALLALAFWLVRRFGGGRLGGGAPRGRQPRLAVIDQATGDSPRRLVLIRRDNVEHLLIIGGPSDVVGEQNILRGAPAPREGGRPTGADACSKHGRSRAQGAGRSESLRYGTTARSRASAPRKER